MVWSSELFFNLNFFSTFLYCSCDVTECDVVKQLKCGRSGGGGGKKWKCGGGEDGDEEIKQIEMW